MIDLHSHILPGIDDGSTDWDKSMAILQVAVENGVTAMVATPHQHPDGQYCNRNERVRALLHELRQRVEAAGLPVALHEGGEVLISPDITARIDAGTAMPYEGGKYLLLELPVGEVPSYTRQVVFDLLVRGITPVIAHPERNEGIARQPELLAELVEAGALAQMTASSISRRTAVEIRELAALLLAHNLVHVMASDTHSPHRRPPVLGRYAQRVASVFGAKAAEDMVHTVPSAILRGDAAAVVPPTSFTRQSKREAVRLAKALVEAGEQRPAKRGLSALLHLPWA